MKNLKPLYVGFLMTAAVFQGQAQITNLDAVKAEIIEISDAETQAFASGDCDKVASLMDDSITFY